VKNVTAIIQARLGSKRLPGKTLMTIEGDTLLGHLIRRVKECKLVDYIIIATTKRSDDDEIVNFAKTHDLGFYRGNEEDVLDRFYKTAIEFDVETIVRVTPDCPMLDSRVTDLVISYYLKGDYDYVSNAIRPTYPDGLDTEVFSFQTLEKAWLQAKLPSEREHVTPYIVKNPGIFRLFNVRKDGEDLSWMRWTVDTEKDLQFVSRIFAELYTTEEIFHMDDVVRLLKKKPELRKINEGISRNEGYQLSLLRDKESGRD
jgi:spore coat polysaccharide biosynthesis protein SpsF (cytidylyltransferase family)